MSCALPTINALASSMTLMSILMRQKSPTMTLSLNRKTVFKSDFVDRDVSQPVSQPISKPLSQHMYFIRTNKLKTSIYLF
jgi:hypothetical protein